MSKFYDDLVAEGVIYGVQETELDKLPTFRVSCPTCDTHWDAPMGYKKGRCWICGEKGSYDT